MNGHRKKYDSLIVYGLLKGLTPMEVYTGKVPVMDFSARFALAKVERMKQNKLTNCGKC